LARGGAVDIARPVFAFGGMLHALSVGVSQKFPDFHEKNHWNTTAMTKQVVITPKMKTGEIENDFESNAANRVRIDKTDPPSNDRHRLTQAH